MKLNKAGLIATIDAIEKQTLADQVEHDAAFVKYKADALAKWKREELPKFKALRDLLSKKIKANGVITSDEVKALGFVDQYRSWSFGWYSEPGQASFFEVDGKSYRGYPVMDQRLAQLRKALELIEEDEVPTSALASMGFRNLEWFFNKVARAQAGL